MEGWTKGGKQKGYWKVSEEQEEEEGRKELRLAGLAHTDKRVRDAQVRILQNWLGTRKENLDELSVMKMWRGLFYCLWMSDKPLVQQELSRNVAKLVHHLQSPKMKLLFVKGMFLTLHREWAGIDRWRMDKFYYFVEQALVESLRVMEHYHWNVGIVESFCTVLGEGPLGTVKEKHTSAGVRLHVAEKLVKALEGLSIQPPAKAKAMLLQAVALALARSEEKLVRRRLQTFVFEPLLKRLLDKEEEEGAFFGDLDGSVVAEVFFEAAADPASQPKGRKLLYGMRRRIQDALEKQVPKEEKKKGQTAYQVYCSEQREDAMKEHPDLKPAAVQRILKGQWKSMGAEERAPYKALAKEEKPEEEEEMEEEKEKPKRRSRRGRKAKVEEEKEEEQMEGTEMEKEKEKPKRRSRRGRKAKVEEEKEEEQMEGTEMEEEKEKPKRRSRRGRKAKVEEEKEEEQMEGTEMEKEKEKPKRSYEEEEVTETKKRKKRRAKKGKESQAQPKRSVSFGKDETKYLDEFLKGKGTPEAPKDAARPVLRNAKPSPVTKLSRAVLKKNTRVNAKMGKQSRQVQSNLRRSKRLRIARNTTYDFYSLSMHPKTLLTTLS